MTNDQIGDQLNAVAKSVDFVNVSLELVQQWTANGAGVECVEPVLRFMESHPFLDIGNPGPLVHFMEKFYRIGYEDRLVESIRRLPTKQTAWVLNRLINGTREPATKRFLIETMLAARDHPLIDKETQQFLAQFLTIHNKT